VDDVRRYGRKTFLLTTAAGFTSLLWAKPAWDTGSRLVLPFVDAFAPGLVPGWRIYSVAGTMPTFDRGSWRLRVDGLVERPVELSYDELLALPRARQVSDFHCVTGWSVGAVHWQGVRIRDVLALARPTSAAHALTFTSAERPYADSLTIEQALLPDVMLASHLGGAPLSRPHGAPLRLVMPEMYGYKGVKWLDRITLTEAAETGYWEQRGYDSDAWIDGDRG
jgi:DMSO/TMAO reductase YedYZ molybdopterin-dependent catalytic subunit